MHRTLARSLLVVLMGSAVACEYLGLNDAEPAPSSSGGGAGAGGGSGGAPDEAAGGTGGADTSSPTIVHEPGELEGFGGAPETRVSTIALKDDVFRVVRRSEDEVIVSGQARLESSETGDWVQCVHETDGVRWKRWLAHGVPRYQGRGEAAVDARGHTWFANSFVGTLRIGDTNVTSVVNPGQPEGNFDEHGRPSDDVFLAEFDELGALVSLRTFGGVGRQSLLGMKLDARGNPVLVGTFSGRMDWGDVELTSSGGSLRADLFVVRLSPEGEVLQAHQFAQTALMVNDFALDSQDRVVMAGGSSPQGGTLDAGTQLELGEGWALALTKDGDIAWSSNFGSPQGLTVSSVAIDSKDNSVFSVRARLAGPVFDTPGDRGAVIVKLDPAGELLFVKRFGEVSVRGVAILPDDSFVLGGHFSDSIDLGGGLLEPFYPGEHDADVFVARLGVNGEHIWSLHAGGNGGDYAPDVALVRSDRVALLGSFSTAIDWGDGAVQRQGGPYLTWLTP